MRVVITSESSGARVRVGLVGALLVLTGACSEASDEATQGDTTGQDAPGATTTDAATASDATSTATNEADAYEVAEPVAACTPGASWQGLEIAATQTSYLGASLDTVAFLIPDRPLATEGSALLYYPLDRDPGTDFINTTSWAGCAWASHPTRFAPWPDALHYRHLSVRPDGHGVSAVGLTDGYDPATEVPSSSVVYCPDIGDLTSCEDVVASSTWRFGNPIMTFTPAGAPRIIYNAWEFAANPDFDPMVFEYFAATRGDDGTWHREHIAQLNGPALGYTTPWVAADGMVTLGLAWHHRTNDRGGYQLLRGQGTDWTVETIAAPSFAGAIAADPIENPIPLALGPDGAPHLVLDTWDPDVLDTRAHALGLRQRFHVWKEAGGWQREALDLAADLGGIDVAVDARGDVHVAASESVVGRSSVMHLWKQGGNWRPRETIYGPYAGGSGKLRWVAEGDDRLHVVAGVIGPTGKGHLMAFRRSLGEAVAAPAVLAWCGDAEVVPGETCDDANDDPNDTCPNDCWVTPTCAAPLDLAAQAPHLEDDFGATYFLAVSLAGRAEGQAVCGGDGSEAVYVQHATSPVFVRADYTGPIGMRLSARRACDSDDHAACGEGYASPGGGQVGTLEGIRLGAGEDLFWHLDVPASGRESVAVTFSTSPIAELGATCSGSPFWGPLCDLGLGCRYDEARGKNVCQGNAAPIVLGATLYVGPRVGRDVVVGLALRDDDDDVVAAQLEAVDASGAPVRWADSDRDGRADSTRLLLQGAALDASDKGHAALFLPGAVAFDVGALTFRVRVLDASNVFSAWTPVTLGAQPIRADGEGCDLARVRDRCTVGLVCAASGATCAPGAAPSAPEVSPLEVQPGERTVVARADDRDADLSYYELAYLDAAGLPLALDTDLDGARSEATKTVYPTEWTWFGDDQVRLSVAGIGADEVVLVDVVAVDASGLRSPPTRARLPAPWARPQ